MLRAGRGHRATLLWEEGSLLLAAARVGIRAAQPQPQAAKHTAKRVSTKADGKMPRCNRAQDRGHLKSVGTSPLGCHNKPNIFSTASKSLGKGAALEIRM